MIYLRESSCQTSLHAENIFTLEIFDLKMERSRFSHMNSSHYMTAGHSEICRYIINCLLSRNILADERGCNRDQPNILTKGL